MAGTLVIDTLTDGSGNTTSATAAIRGSAKAWVNFNGVTTAAIRASYNVSSIVRNGLGDYTVNFTNALSDANYAANVNSAYGSAANQPVTSTNVFSSASGAIAPTSSSFRFYCLYSGSFGAADSAYYNVAVFR